MKISVSPVRTEVTRNLGPANCPARACPVAAGAMRWVITGPDLLTHNDPGRARQVDVASGMVNVASGRIAVAPLSVTLLAIPVLKGH